MSGEESVSFISLFAPYRLLNPSRRQTWLKQHPSKRPQWSHRGRWQASAILSSTQELGDVIDTALSSGIKSVAVGKFGSKSVGPTLAAAIREELRRLEDGEENGVLFVQRASFMGSLFVKSNLEEHEKHLLSICRDPDSVASDDGVVDGARSCSPRQLLSYVTKESTYDRIYDHELFKFALMLLEGKRLNENESHELGQLLYSTEKDQGILALKTLIVHVMRVRHESSAELTGLAKAARESLNPKFIGSGRAERPLVVTALLAEPFDGVRSCEILTPLMARHLKRKYGILPIMSSGRSAGPKYGPNLKSLNEALGLAPLNSVDDLMTSDRWGDYGLSIDQGRISDGLEGWVDIRRLIIKRPALATVEKYVDIVPGSADLFIASAFHGNYVEKMMDVAEGVGYPCYIITQKGSEGTLGLGISSKTRAGISVGIKDGKGDYVRKHFEYGAADAGIDIEQVKAAGDATEKGEASLERNVNLIKKWVDHGGNSDNVTFDARVAITLGALDRAMKCIFEVNPGLLSKNVVS